MSCQEGLTGGRGWDTVGGYIMHFTAHNFKTSPYKMFFGSNESVLEPDTGNSCTTLCTKCYFKAVHGMFCEFHPTIKQKPNTSPPGLPSSKAQTPLPQSTTLSQADPPLCLGCLHLPAQKPQGSSFMGPGQKLTHLL